MTSHQEPSELDKALIDILFKASGGLGDMAGEEIEKIKQAIDKHVLGRIYNLANDYACKDTTMVGSESIRGYHYFNALNKVTEEVTGRDMGR
jgi:hypothetical protein